MNLVKTQHVFQTINMDLLRLLMLPLTIVYFHTKKDKNNNEINTNIASV